MYKIIEKQKDIKYQFESSIHGVLSYLEKRWSTKEESC